MSTYEELVLDFKELRFLAIRCPHCETEVVLDVASKRASIPTACPSCREGGFDPTFQASLDTYREAYRQLASDHLKHRVQVRVCAATSRH